MSDFFWGLLEPSGEDCVAADSALKWKWNSLRFESLPNVSLAICVGCNPEKVSNLKYQNQHFKPNLGIKMSFVISVLNCFETCKYSKLNEYQDDESKGPPPAVLYLELFL